MNNNFLNTETPSLENLFASDKTYIVPKYQRNYSWNEEQWEDLWLDIEELQNSTHPHFMGSIVLQEIESKNKVDIIDGQQRLTTLTILIVAVLHNIEELVKSGKDTEFNKERIEIFEKKYLGYKNPTTLNIVPKLSLNHTNNNFFTHYIVKRIEPSAAQLRNEDSSNQLMFKAFEFFKKKIKERIVSDNGEEFAEYIGNIGSQLKFIQIAVQNELDAYTLFETLNARGVELTSADLLKNYLFNLLKSNENEIKLADNKWKEINSKIPTKDLPDYFRCVMNSEIELVRKNKLFKRFKEHIKDIKSAARFLDRLYTSASLYLALQNSNDAIWGNFGNSQTIKKYIKILDLFKVKIPMVLLLVSLETFEKQEDKFVKILRACTILAIRYSITHTRTNILEISYNKIACEIFKNKNNIKIKEILKQLENVNVSDDAFKDAFVKYTKKATSGNDAKIVKFLLVSIENHLSGANYNDEQVTIEHILPKSKERGYNKSDIIHRLGNYTLLSESDNQTLKNVDYDKKIERYKNSKFKLTQHIANTYQKWDINSINGFQKYLATQALALWKIK